MDNRINSELNKKFKESNDKLILLDYDGTLVNYASRPEKAIPTERLKNILVKLVDIPRLKIIIISGRLHHDIDLFLGHYPIDIIAEHGAMMKENGVWKQRIIDNGLWKQKILPVLNRITLACPNSFVEEKLFSLVWHYRNSDNESGFKYSRELLQSLESISHINNLKILDGNKVIEIMSNENGKGNAVKKIIEKSKYDFILSIGDDKTDEEMFEVLLPYNIAYSVKVGNGSTFAKYRVENVNDVFVLLEQL